MKVQGTFNVKAPIQKVWDSVWNEETLPTWVPGCTRAEIKDDRHIVATVEQAVAFLKSRFDIDLEVTEREDPNRAVFTGSGKDPKIASTLKLTLELRMKELSEQETEVSYEGEVNMFGRVASIGHFVIQAKAKELEREFVKKVQAMFES